MTDRLPQQMSACREHKNRPGRQIRSMRSTSLTKDTTNHNARRGDRVSFWRRIRPRLHESPAEPGIARHRRRPALSVFEARGFGIIAAYACRVHERCRVEPWAVNQAFEAKSVLKSMNQRRCGSVGDWRRTGHHHEEKMGGENKRICSGACLSCGYRVFPIPQAKPHICGRGSRESI